MATFWKFSEILLGDVDPSIDFSLLWLNVGGIFGFTRVNVGPIVDYHVYPGDLGICWDCPWFQYIQRGGAVDMWIECKRCWSSRESYGCDLKCYKIWISMLFMSIYTYFYPCLAYHIKVSKDQRTFPKMLSLTFYPNFPRVLLETTIGLVSSMSHQILYPIGPS